MPLSVGNRLGPYEILAAVGSGGMGEVYKARDTRLNRTVAIKVLSTALDATPEMRARFEREARAVAALQHPNICVLHDVGSENGVQFLVMEYLEGETLAARLARSPLPLAELARVGTEIARALERAHRAGIVHRDLKPGNIMLTKAGAKLLDFGLAAAASTAAAPAPSFSATMAATALVSPVTQAGTVVGTVQYMSPEQIEGKPADARSDIFALGCVLYEMASGQRAFAGKSSLSIASAILEREPEPLAPAAPATLDRLIRDCLVKNPDERLQSAHDVALQLAAIGAAPMAMSVSAPRRRHLFWEAAAGALALALLLGYFIGGLGRKIPLAPVLLRTSLQLPPGFQLDTADSSLALSPDGTELALVGSLPGGRQQLWLRPTGGATLQPVPGTTGALYPFWSPDSRWIGFFAGGKLRKIAMGGVVPIVLCDAPHPRGGSWSSKGTILFAPQILGGLFAIPAIGGDARQVTRPEGSNSSDRLPDFLPDGDFALFHRGTSNFSPSDGIYFLDLASGRTTLLAHEPSAGIYVPAPAGALQGYLVFWRDQYLMAQPFAPARRRLSGEAVPFFKNPAFNPLRWTGAYTFSGNGLFVAAYGTSAAPVQFTWFDWDGKPLGTMGGSVHYSEFALSPSGTVAVATDDAVHGAPLQLIQLPGGAATQFTFGETHYNQMAWSPDGREIAFDDASDRLYIKAADGSSAVRQIASAPPPADFPEWTPDGRSIVYSTQVPGGFQLYTVAASGAGKPAPLLSGTTVQGITQFSPDGRWLAFFASSGTATELYVAAASGAGGRWQISNGGADTMAWLPNGHHLAYVTGDLHLVEVETGGAGAVFVVGQRRTLFGGKPLPVAADLFDSSAQNNLPGFISADGRRLLLPVPVASAGGGQAPLCFVTNWSGLLTLP